MSADAGIEPRTVALYALPVSATIDNRATSKPQYYMFKSFNRPAGLTGQKKSTLEGHSVPFANFRELFPCIYANVQVALEY